MAKNVVTLAPESITALAAAVAAEVPEGEAADGNGFKRVPFVKVASGTHVVSAGVTRVDLEAWGGGGASAADGSSASGAGGGWAIKHNVAVTPAQVLTVVVGAGGTTNPGSDNGNPGANSKVSNATPTVLVEAGGGEGSKPTGNPAAGGAVVTGDYGIVGGTGESGGGIGGNGYTRGGMGANGGAGGSGIGSGGQQRAPSAPGGGGGGGNGTNGMNGALGRVIVWEYQQL